MLVCLGAAQPVPLHSREGTMAKPLGWPGSQGNARFGKDISYRWNRGR